MTADFTPPDPVQPPSFLLNLAQMAGQHFFTVLSGVLLTNGAISKDQTSMVVSLGASAVAALVGLGWHYWLIISHRANANARVAQAIVQTKAVQ